MYQETIGTKAAEGYRSMAFSRRVMTICSTGAVRAVRPARLEEALQALRFARMHLGGLAPDAVLAEVLGKNPDVFQVIDPQDKRGDGPTFLAYLPLNRAGAQALAADRFSAARPNLGFLCGPQDQPSAIYIWLIFAPRALAAALRELSPLLGRLAPAGCPLFTRAATRPSERLFATMGFVSAGETYPRSASDLLVLPPRSGCPTFEDCEGQPPPRRITVRVARTIEDVMKCFSVRAATYMAEQECPFDEEFDGNDFCATHLVGEIDGEPAGCIRVRYFADFVKIERLAVRQEFRTSRLSFNLVREALAYCRRKGFRRAYGHSRSDLTRFWGLFGFREIPDRPRFRFSEVEYVELEASLTDDEGRLAIGHDPYVLIRPEGDWDRPGPLDRSATRPSASGEKACEARRPAGTRIADAEVSAASARAAT